MLHHAVDAVVDAEQQTVADFADAQVGKHSDEVVAKTGLVVPTVAFVSFAAVGIVAEAVFVRHSMSPVKEA